MAKFTDNVVSMVRPLPGITAENFRQKTKDYIDLAGNYFLIKPDMLAHLSAWNSYFRFKGMGKQPTPWDKPVGKSVWRLNFEVHGDFGVPAEWPWYFDQAVNESDLGDFRNPVELRRLEKLVAKALAVRALAEKNAIWPMPADPRPETRAEMARALKEAGVDHLPENCNERMIALGEWAKKKIAAAILDGKQKVKGFT